jgi:hypothetical protein
MPHAIGLMTNDYAAVVMRCHPMSRCCSLSRQNRQSLHAALVSVTVDSCFHSKKVSLHLCVNSATLMTATAVGALNSSKGRHKHAGLAAKEREAYQYSK